MKEVRFISDGLTYKKGFRETVYQSFSAESDEHGITVLCDSGWELAGEHIPQGLTTESGATRYRWEELLGGAATRELVWQKQGQPEIRCVVTDAELLRHEEDRKRLLDALVTPAPEQIDDDTFRAWAALAGGCSREDDAICVHGWILMENS